MHIPDGFLTGEAAALGTATAIAGVAVCLRGARRTDARDGPARSPAWRRRSSSSARRRWCRSRVGTQGHLLGGALAVALLGPWLGGADDHGRLR